MHTALDAFLENMTLIISFMFIVLKAEEYFSAKFKTASFALYLAPLIASLLSVFVMHHPLIEDGMRFDLRGVPLFFITYVGGWKMGLAAILLPIYFRIDFGGPNILIGIIQGILMPYLFGAMLHRKAAFTPPHTLIELRHMLLAFIVSQIFRSVIILLTTPPDVRTLFTLMGFEIAALFAIGLMFNDSNRQAIAIKELKFQSRHDGMTSLYNLNYFKKKAEKLIEQKQPFVIAMFDVDYFKQFNDTHGHMAGDLVLQTIGKILGDSVRKEDLFARYGGEEFIICFSGVKDVDIAMNIAERFRKKVEEYNFYGEETQPGGQITVSIGLSRVAEDKAMDEAIEEADRALYEAKRAGRNRVSRTPSD